MIYEHERPEKESRMPRGVSAPYPKFDERLEEMAEAYLIGRGINPAVASMNRCYPSSDAMDRHPRFVIPAVNTAGTGYWQARAMVDVQPRYQSPYVQRGDSLIVMWPLVLMVGAPIVVVEGPFDALAAATTGLVGVALMGASPNDDVLSHVASLLPRCERLIIADMDEQAAATFVSAQLAARGNKSRVLFPAPYKDLCACPIQFRTHLLGATL